MAAAIAPSEAATPRAWARGMPRRDVPDLMADDARELGFGIQVHQQSTVHVDVAAAGHERVDVRVVEHEEPELLVGQIAGLGQPLADDVHVLLHGLVVVQPQDLDDLLVMLLYGFLFPFQAAHADALAARGRIAHAARGERNGGREDEGEQLALHVGLSAVGQRGI
jgi:hypothetical protein